MPKHKYLLLAAVAVYVLGVFVFALLALQTLRREVLQYTDRRLITAVQSALPLVGRRFHRRATGPQQVSEQTDLTNVLNLTRLAELQGLKFVYTVVRTNGRFYITASSSNPGELRWSTYVRYWTLYRDAPHILDTVYRSGKVHFHEYNDRWGAYRSLFVPVVMEDGRKFVIVADTSYSEAQQFLQEGLLLVIGGSVFFLLLLLPFIWLFRRMVQREKHYLVHQAYFDNLTGLPNRTRLLADEGRADNPLVLLIDIDGFNHLNDNLGYEAGDFILNAVGLRLRQQIRRIDKLGAGAVTLYKLPADEFAVLFPDAPAPMDVRRFLEMLSRGVNEDPIALLGSELPVTVTIGGACRRTQEQQLPGELSRALSTLVYADMALKQARALRVDYIIFDNSLPVIREYQETLRWAGVVKQALRDGQILLHYQPIIENASGRTVKYECLVRLQDESGGVIPPGRFLDVARKIRLYPRITRFVVTESLRYFRDRSCAFSVNISAEDIRDVHTREHIYQELHKNRKTAVRLIFELVESEGIQDFPEVNQFIRTVKGYGCRIAIDDFGSGYSNFSYLLRLQVDFIKLDSSIVQGLTLNQESSIIIETIVGFCKKMGIATIAEFVSSKGVYDRILELGIDYSQGYYFGKPVPEVDGC